MGCWVHLSMNHREKDFQLYSKLTKGVIFTAVQTAIKIKQRSIHSPGSPEHPKPEMEFSLPFRLAIEYELDRRVESRELCSRRGISQQAK